MNGRTETRRNLTWGAVGLTIGILLTAVLVIAAAPGQMIEERLSPYDVDSTVRTITGNAVSQGWKISKIYNLRESLARPSEAKLPPIQVVEMCQLDYTRDLLASGRNRFVSTMMPCAVAVYEKEDGKTYVASMNVGLMGRLFGGEISNVMAKVGRDDEVILRFLAAR